MGRYHSESADSERRLTMPRSSSHRGESSRASCQPESTVQRTDDPMPSFTLCTLRREDLPRLDRGVRMCTRGRLEEPSQSEGEEDLCSVTRFDQVYCYLQGDDYPKHFPLDEHLFPLVQSFVPTGWNGPTELLAIERVQMERAILVGRDSILGTCGPEAAIGEAAGEVHPAEGSENAPTPSGVQVVGVVVSTTPGAGEPLLGGSADASAGECSHLPKASGPEAAIGEAAGEVHPAEGSENAPTPSGVQVVGSGPLQATSSGALFEEFGAFSDHGILWPSAPQSVQISDAGGMMESLLGPARSAMEASSPPSIEVVRGFLHRGTLAYHLMGCPRDPWMAVVDSLWGEAKQRHQEEALTANRLKVQELTAEIASVEQESEAFRSRRGDLTGRVETLRAGHACCNDDIAALRRTIEDASNRLAECEAASTALARGVAEGEAEMADIDAIFAYTSFASSSGMPFSFREFIDQGKGIAYYFGLLAKELDLTYYGGLLAKGISVSLPFWFAG
ncbi:hypothetical protein Taro_032389 [Colocasia esculenta]|uniref:Uncharacterized protein n=1 Tax=Colocasia esculenta TaxID=4460 RepID=A0A843W3S4_COLES|nr:hypothetical protein [Colocasia esculenta]